MNYYPHHIGDYDSHTSHLTWAEDLAYRRLICLYYRTEKPLPNKPEEVCRLIRAEKAQEKKAVLQVLNEFFIRTDDGWKNARCDDEISKAQAKAERNREVGKKGGRPRKPATETVNSGNPEITQMVSENNPNITLPIANSQEPITKEKATAANNPSGMPLKYTWPPSPDVEKTEHSENLIERPAQISVLLRTWEKARGKVAKTTSSNPILQAWSEAGVTDQQLREAYEIAVADREAKGDITAINAGFLDLFVVRLLNPGEGVSAINRVATATAKPWQASWSGIEGKGRELGIIQAPSEHPQAFKARVFEAAQMTEHEKAMLRADHGVQI